jgi:phthalate 4,5-dioxygenase oxygenase subunit
MRKQDNELLTRTGPDTPMGDLFRQYWIPAMKSDDLEVDAAPIRLRLLGENLIAFRTTSGKVGIFEHHCPHRCASLYYGRNEGDGIRCVYHGWKFDVTGQCLETPTETADSDIKDQVHATAYVTRERGGVVWVYMGDKDAVPELPEFEANLLPEGARWVVCGLRECNWLQALEGDIDTAHLSFLHLGALDENDFPPGSPAYYFQKDKAPKFEVHDTDYGTMYGAYRPGGEENMYWRIAHFLMPFWTMPPGGPLQSNIIARAWVPIDDENTMFWHLSAPIPERPPIQLADSKGKGLVGIHFKLEENQYHTSDWLGRSRYKNNAANDYGIDREVQASDSYSGIDGVHMQDQAVTESMGKIVDRTQEHLASSDKMIIMTRRKLLAAAQAYSKDKVLPDDVNKPEVFNGQRSGEMIIPEDADWLKEYKDICKKCVNTETVKESE